MKKTWHLGNGWNRVNDYGQCQLIEIGPRDFDPDEQIMSADDVQWMTGAQLPYFFDNVKHVYVFRRKRDFLTAVANLRKEGYVS